MIKEGMSGARVRGGEGVTSPWDSFLGACYHSSLTRCASPWSQELGQVLLSVPSTG